MKILVTGAAGLIGRECVSQLLAAGHSVRALDLRASALAASKQLELFEGDLLDRPTRLKAIDGVEGIVHLAAVSRVADAEADPAQAVRTNVVGTANLLEDSQELPESPWFIHASSREVYGEPKAIPVAEDAPLHPINIYGTTKAQCEPLVRYFANRSASPCVLLRFSNVYGSAFDHPKRAVPTFVTAALAQKPFEVHDGRKILDFTHVEDAGRAVMRAVGWASARRGTGEHLTVNVCTGAGTTLAELARAILDASGSITPFVETRARDFDVNRFVGEGRLASRALDFTARVALQDGLKRTVEAFRAAA